MEPIQIRMLGEFSLTTPNASISDVNKRSRKNWGILAFLICNRHRTLPQKKLLELLYGEDGGGVNPENALRITLHRIRTELDGLWPGAGKDLILYRNGGYCWNPEIPVTLDCERFDQWNPAHIQEPEQRLSLMLEALKRYQGEFLPRHSGESWVIPISAHFHNCFVEMTLESAHLLMERQRYLEAAGLCRKAVEAEPYHEVLHQVFMRALGAAGDPKAAAGVYDTLKKRLFDDFGIHPSEETKAVYRQCAHSPGDRTLPMEEVLEGLREESATRGAMVCDYDYFKVLCHSESRSMERSGHATHVALLNLVFPGEKELSKRSQDHWVGQFGEHIRLNLRRGDTIARCSVSQYIIMLPKANYENSSMVCRRIISAFHHAHPRASIKVNYMVQPLTPGINVP